MFHKSSIIALGIIFLTNFSLIAQQNSSQRLLLIEDFEYEKVGDLPSRWYNQKGEAKPFEYDQELKSTYHYKIMEEQGNHFLRFEGNRGKHMSYPLINNDSINIKETPILSWSWRIHDIPEGANEDDSDKNDVAASIYVAFDMGRVALFKKVPKTIRYTWSSTLPVGTELSKFYGNQKIIVVGSGEEKSGDWLTFERNIVEDYKRLFGDEPPAKPLAILILSDANNTQNKSKADYDDIMLKSKSAN